MDNMQPSITAPEQVPVRQYVYIATIQRYLVSQQGIQTSLPQPPSIPSELPPYMFPAAGQRHTPARLFYIRPLNMPRYAARQHHPHKAISEGPGVGETLLGCGMLLVAGILVLMLLYYLSAAR
jgi:hypothetical protein